MGRFSRIGINESRVIVSEKFRAILLINKRAIKVQRTVNVRQRPSRWVTQAGKTWRMGVYDRRWGTGGSNRHIYGRITCEVVRVNDVQIFNVGDAHALQNFSQRLSGTCPKDENPNLNSQAFIEKFLPRGVLVLTSCHYL